MNVIPDAVLFDLDGTLVDTNIDFSLMKREMLALALAQGLSSEAINGLDILGIVDTAEYYLRSQGKKIEALDLKAQAMFVLESIEVRHARDAVEIEGAKHMVNMLREHEVKVGIVTRNCRKASELALAITSIEPDVLVCREDTFRHKPHPEPLLYALGMLKARAEASVMVGDHTMDIQAGKAANMQTIALLHEDRSANFFDQINPDFVARNLREALGAIISCSG